MSRRVNDERAEHAFEFIQGISGVDKEKKEFRSLARSFPTMVQNNGLNVAVAFLLTKNSKDDEGKKKFNGHKMLHSRLAEWLKRRELINSENLTKALIELKREEYRLVSQEVMEYASWIKRFAEGRWDKDGKEKSSSED